jgi:hypothetical protein
MHCPIDEREIGSVTFTELPRVELDGGGAQAERPLLSSLDPLSHGVGHVSPYTIPSRESIDVIVRSPRLSSSCGHHLSPTIIQITSSHASGVANLFYYTGHICRQADRSGRAV